MTVSANPNPHQVRALEEQYNRGNYPVVLEACEKLLELFPDSPVVYNAQGMTLLAVLQPAQALEAFNAAIKLLPDNAEAYLNRGLAFYALGQTGNALNAYNKAIQLDPKNAKAYNNRGTVLHETGRLDDAKRSYFRAVSLDPAYANAHRNLSHLKTYQSGDNQIVLMENLLSDKQLSDTDRCHVCFALAKAYEDLADYDSSFRYLQTGNLLRKNALGFDLDSELTMASKMKDIFSGFDLSSMVSPEPSKNQIRPVFIVGMIRSGTTLAEQIIASHSEVYGAGELYAIEQLMISADWQQMATRNDPEFDAFIKHLRAGYLEKLNLLKRPEQVIIDKMPANFRWLGFVLCAFPEARVVNLTRDPVATCWSAYKNYFSSNALGYAYDFDDLADFYRHYIDLMSFWRNCFPDRIYDLCYENLTENQEPETRKLLEFCELEMQQQCLDFHKAEGVVKTASTLQVREQMYQGSSTAWKRYEKHLQPLIKQLP